MDQLRDGPGSRLLLIALEGGDVETRAELSAALAAALRGDREFSNVGNGEAGHGGIATANFCSRIATC